MSTFHRNKTRVSTQLVSRTPSQRYISSDKINGSYTPTAKICKQHDDPHVPTGTELEDILEHVYDTTLTASQHVMRSCPNLPGLIMSSGGPATTQLGGENHSLEDMGEYEVMLATGANPAYKNVQHPPAADVQSPLAGIYEQLP